MGGNGGQGLGRRVVYRERAAQQTQGYPLDPSAPPAWMWRGQDFPARPQRWLPVLTTRGRLNKSPVYVLAHLSPLPPAWPGLPFLALRFKAKFSVSFLFLSYPCPIATPFLPTLNLPDSIFLFPNLLFPSFSLSLWALLIFHLQSFLPLPTLPSSPPSPSLLFLRFLVAVCACVYVCV